MFLLFASFLAGILTSLAPCILPLLPVIVGSSIVKSKDNKIDRLKPYIIAISLAVSVVLFTLLLKVSSVLIGVDPSVWLYISGGIVILLGINLLFPSLWVRFNLLIGLEKNSNQFLARASKHRGLLGAILTGAALGPVFSSCSPVYALVLATILPVHVAIGLIYIIAYAIGLGLALLAIALAGRKLTSKLKWAINPNGIFRQIIGIILIIIGAMVLTGSIQKFQVWSAQFLPFDETNIEQSLITSNNTHAPSASPATSKKQYNVTPYNAPEITGIANWINSNPLKIASLKGKVVLIDFWTYSCINCQRTQPFLNSWYDKYEKDGLVIIGVHAPEFSFEKVQSNVAKAVADEGIKYPVAMDNDLATWNAYSNQYWPAKYLIDKDGQVRYTQFGEGQYDQTESVIQDLLKGTGKAINQPISANNAPDPVQNGQTPETYLSYNRGERFANSSDFQADKTANYTLAKSLDEHYWSLGGSWQVGAMDTVAKGDTNKLALNFTAKEVYLVMNGPTDQPVTLTVNGEKVTATHDGGDDVDADGNVHLDGARLYKIVNMSTFTHNARLEINLPKGTTINAFTFGGA